MESSDAPELDEASINAIDCASGSTKNSDSFARPAIVGIAFDGFESVPQNTRHESHVARPASHADNENHAWPYFARVVERIIMQNCAHTSGTTRPIPEIKHTSGFAIGLLHRVPDLERFGGSGEAEENKRHRPRVAGIDPETPLVFANALSDISARLLLAYSNFVRRNFEHLRQQLAGWSWCRDMERGATKQSSPGIGTNFSILFQWAAMQIAVPDLEKSYRPRGTVSEITINLQWFRTA
jgi:hypothetical protein